MKTITNQTEATKLNRLSLNKETITDLEITRNEQDDVRGGGVQNTLVGGDPQSVIGPKTISARCTYLCK